jgi:RNA polymerase sigma-70 factor, ECF subfamily
MTNRLASLNWTRLARFSNSLKYACLLSSNARSQFCDSKEQFMVSSTEFNSMGLERYRTYLLMLARSQPRLASQDASDIVQKVMLVAHRRQRQFRGNTSNQMALWLKQILRSQLIDAYRQQHRLKRDINREGGWQDAVDGSLSRMQQWAAVQSTPSEHASNEEQLLRMAAAIAQLLESQREAILLHYLQGLSLAEVAVQLQRTEPAVAGLLHRGLKQLRRLLNASEPS